MMIPRLMAAWNIVYLLVVTMLGRFGGKKRKSQHSFSLSSIKLEEFALDRVLRQIKQLVTCFNPCCFFFFNPTMQAFVYCFITHYTDQDFRIKLLSAATSFQYCSTVVNTGNKSQWQFLWNYIPQEKKDLAQKAFSLKTMGLGWCFFFWRKNACVILTI